VGKWRNMDAECWSGRFENVGGLMVKLESWEIGRHNVELGELRNQDAEWPFERLQEWEMSIGCREENYIYTAPFLGSRKRAVRSCEPHVWGPNGNIASASQGLSCPVLQVPLHSTSTLPKAGFACWWSLHASSNSKAVPSAA
jgi:hypothetical protein